MIKHTVSSPKKSQQGAVLLVSLLLLLGMTLVGIASIDNTSLQAQMSRNSLESNQRYQLGLNEIELQLRQTAQSLARRTALVHGDDIDASDKPGVSKSGTGITLADATEGDILSKNEDDAYEQSGQVVFPGYYTGASHGFTIGQTRKMVVEINIITQLTDTQSKTDLTQAATYSVPADQS